MCRIEVFDVVYPNGPSERREQVVPCPRGTRSQACRHAQFTRIGDRFASASDLRPLVQPHIVQIEPRDLESSRPHSGARERNRDRLEGMTLDFKIWNPFSSKKKEKKGKWHYYITREGKKPQPRPPVIQHEVPIPPPPGPFYGPPSGVRSPVVVPIQPPEDHPPHHSPERPPRRRSPIPTVIHQSSEENEDDSSSPPEANREHGRRTRSLSPMSRYEAEKEIIRLRELGERERRARIRSQEREARERAAILERVERQRERDARRERQERRRSRERVAAEWEARRQREERDREQARIRQEREDLERLTADRARRRRENRARRLQEEEDLERRMMADRARQLREERARQLREEQAQRRWEEEHLERRRAADRDAFWRLRDEQARRARAWQANIPRNPRHPVFVHQDHVDRGERTIRNAIRAENLRQFERRAGWPRGRYDDGVLRRRNTIDGDQRRYDGHWRDRR